MGLISMKVGMWIRDGPKFGRRRSSAEGFGRMFGSVRLGNMWLFGRTSANIWRHL